MPKHWIIRGLFLGLLMLIVGECVWAETHSRSIRYFHNGRWVKCETRANVVNVALVWDNRPQSELNGWLYQTDRIRPYPARYYGFDFHHFADANVSAYVFFVPYWFILCIPSGVMFFVWWKTRPKINPKMAFPVEVGKKHG
jgi:hypothetical protein